MFLTAAAVAAVIAMRHGRHAATGRTAPGGILVGDAVVYDALSHLILGSLFRRISADIAAVAPDGARVLEVGCGPGHLSTRLARQHRLDVTGLDLDPAMIARARAKADRRRDADQRQPSFLVGDVGSLAFPDKSFDLVVSTLSMHHWADPTAGLAEIGRVLRPGARALIWDFRPGVWPHPFGPRHAHAADPLDHAPGAQLELVTTTPWHWPWRFSITQRIELARPDREPRQSGEGTPVPSC